MPLADFIHLRVHTAYSLSSGAITIKELVARCTAERMPAVAITDSGNLFGALEFATACAAAGVQPIIGCEMALAPRAEGGRGNGALARPMAEPDRLVLLVQNETGYRNLLALVSRSFLDGEGAAEPAVALADLAAANDGLICLSGGPRGPVGRLARRRPERGGRGGSRRAESGVSGPALRRADAPWRAARRRAASPASSISPIATTCRSSPPTTPIFPTAISTKRTTRCLCIAQGKAVADNDRKRLTPDHYFRPAAEMREVFADLPEACDNTLVIARRCAFHPAAAPADPAGLPDRRRRRARRRRCAARRSAGLDAPPRAARARRRGSARPYRERLEFELGTIIQMGFAGYFLIVADFIQWAKREGIPVGPGRGSGAGSVVAWALTITDLDPLRFGLLFERFLNPERVSMPDFDIDFCQDRRDEVIRYVQQKYGRDRVAQIITFGKLQARAVLRDVGRVLAMPYGQIDRLCKLVPNNPAHPVTLEKAIAGEPALQQARDGDEAVARLIEIALKLEGLYRHASTHAAGVVIGDRPLAELVPLVSRSALRHAGDPVQHEMGRTGGARQIRLSRPEDADRAGPRRANCWRRAGSTLDLADLPLDDRATYDLLARGDTVGVFQLEGAGVRDMLKRLRPDRFEDIIAVGRALSARPDGEHPALHRRQARRRNGRLPAPGARGDPQGNLRHHDLPGAGHADRPGAGGLHARRRRSVAPGDGQEDQVGDGGAAPAVSSTAPRRAASSPGSPSMIFDQMAKFAGYGFNKSHAAAYALVAYQTAYLKANHPVEFMAALMTLDLGNTDKLNLLRQEAGPARHPAVAARHQPLAADLFGRAAPIPTLPRGRGRAGWGKPAIRYALAAVKGVGAAGDGRCWSPSATGTGGSRISFDLAQRLDARTFNRGQFESLAKAGAFDPLDPNRAQTFAAAELLLRQASRSREGARGRPGQPVRRRPRRSSGIAAGRRLAAGRKTAAGIRRDRLLSVEPSARRLRPEPRTRRHSALGRFAERIGGERRHPRSGSPASSLGRKERTSARGNRFAFVQMSDPSGVFEVTLFAEMLSEARALFDGGQPLVVTVDVRSEEDSLRLTAQKIEPLDDVVAHAAAGLRVFLGEARALTHLKNLFGREGGGRGRVSVVVDLDDSEVEIAIPGGFRVDPRMRAAVKSLPGVVDVHDI